MEETSKFQLLNNLVDHMETIEPSMENFFMRLATPTLYHGTDARIVKMPEKKRIELHDMYEHLGDYLFEYYKPHCDSNGILQDVNERIPNDEELSHNLRLSVSYWAIKTDGAKYWQYENNGIYLTQFIQKAIRYAYSSRDFGEIGSIVYWMIKGMKAYDIVIDHYVVQEAIDTALAFSEEDPQPVVYVFDGLDYKKMKTADERKEVDLRNIAAVDSVFYIGDVEMTDENALYLKTRLH
jgi:hypothetical protein